MIHPQDSTTTHRVTVHEAKRSSFCGSIATIFFSFYLAESACLPNALNTFCCCLFFISLLGKLAGRATYFADVFSLFFLVVASGAPLAQKLMDRSSPKF